jgi:peptide/nickel transport system permease protein
MRGDDRPARRGAGLAAHAARRAALAVFLVFAVSSASLVLVRLAPGDFATGALGLGASPEDVAQLRARYGLDRSVPRQYWEWLAGAVRLDFGRSIA